jgi:hypothetical protein
VVPDGADGPRFDESNAKLHKIVTKCRLSAGLVTAYYDDTPKSFLWQEPSRYSAGPAASQKAAKNAGLLIGSTHVQQAEYLDALPAAAYVLDYPLLALEEPSIYRGLPSLRAKKIPGSCSPFLPPTRWVKLIKVVHHGALILHANARR